MSETFAEDDNLKDLPDPARRAFSFGLVTPGSPSAAFLGSALLTSRLQPGRGLEWRRQVGLVLVAQVQIHAAVSWPESSVRLRWSMKSDWERCAVSVRNAYVTHARCRTALGPSFPTWRPTLIGRHAQMTGVDRSSLVK